MKTNSRNLTRHPSARRHLLPLACLLTLCMGSSSSAAIHAYAIATTPDEQNIAADGQHIDDGESFAAAVSFHSSATSLGPLSANAASSSSNGVLRSRAFAMGPSDGGEQSFAEARWLDTVILGGGTASALIFRYRLGGRLDISVSDPISGSASASAQFQIFLGHGSFLAQVSFEELKTAVQHDTSLNVQGAATLSPSGFDSLSAIDGFADIRFDLANNAATYQTFLFTRANALGGSATSDFSSTAELIGIFLPDGTTPESHGMTLTFESGMQSPNLVSAAVPEPASLFAWSAFALLGLAARRTRRTNSALAVSGRSDF